MANQREPKKSKYFRDANDKPTSKYIKSEGAKSTSKYIKTEGDRKAEKAKAEQRNPQKTSYRKSAATSNVSNRTDNKAVRKPTPKPKTDNLPEEVSSLDEVQERKGDQASIFTNKEADLNAIRNYKEAEQTPDESRRKTQTVRNILLITALLVVAVMIQFIIVNQRGEIEFMPRFLTIEFSAIPEFIASLAFGPVVGVVMIVLKNIIHILLTPLILHTNPSDISELSNTILDSFFIFLGGWIYTRRMFNFKPQKNLHKTAGGKDYRTRRIMLGGFVGTLSTSIATFFTTRFMAYPLIVRLYGPKSPAYTDVSILATYNEALENIGKSFPEIADKIPEINNSFNRAILMFNVPLTFLKYIFITVIVALLYPPISDFLHYRVRSKKRK